MISHQLFRQLRPAPPPQLRFDGFGSILALYLIPLLFFSGSIVFPSTADASGADPCPKPAPAISPCARVVRFLDGPRLVHVCPTRPGGGGGEVVCSCYGDTKGGKWTEVCTNKGALGNFEYRYDEKGAGVGEKTYGICRYEGGQNEWKPQWKNGNLVSVQHINEGKFKQDASETRKGQRATERVICTYDKTVADVTKRGKKWIEVRDNQTGCWKKKPGCDPADFETKARVIVGPRNEAAADTACDPGQAGPAEYETSMQLYPAVSQGQRVIKWQIGALTPTLTAGDYVNIDQLTTADLISWDSRFNPSNSPHGLRLTALVSVSPFTGEILAAVHPTKSTVRYAIVDEGAADFWTLAHSTGSPLDSLFGGCTPDLPGLPGYSSGVGEFELGNPVPAAGPVGLSILSLILAAASSHLYRRHRRMRAAMPGVRS